MTSGRRTTTLIAALVVNGLFLLALLLWIGVVEGRFQRLRPRSGFALRYRSARLPRRRHLHRRAALGRRVRL